MFFGIEDWIGSCVSGPKRSPLGPAVIVSCLIPELWQIISCGLLDAYGSGIETPLLALSMLFGDKSNLVSYVLLGCT